MLGGPSFAPRSMPETLLYSPTKSTTFKGNQLSLLEVCDGQMGTACCSQEFLCYLMRDCSCVKRTQN